VYVIENNQWGMGTNWKRVSSEKDFSLTAAAYEMKGLSCDGMYLEGVRDAMREAVDLARGGEPSLVEARTYRYKGHSMSDPGKYRSRDDVEQYRKRDPIAALKGRMTEAGTLSEAEWAAICSRVDAKIEAAVAFAEASAEPAPGELYTDIYASAALSGGS